MDSHFLLLILAYFAFIIVAIQSPPSMIPALLIIVIALLLSLIMSKAFPQDPRITALMRRDSERRARERAQRKRR